MKLKTKLFSLVIVFMFIVSILMVGVYAVKSTDFNLGGDISFTTSGIEATISKGTLSNATWVNADDANTKMKEIEINTNKTQSQLQNEFASWIGLNLAFNEAGDDASITFSITNNSSSAKIKTELSTSGTMDNAYISLNKTSANIAAGASEEFVITFIINEKTVDASITNFNITLNMTHVDDSLTFSYNTTNNTATITAFNDSIKNLVIPSKVTNENGEFTITEIGGSAFAGCTNLKSVFVPSTVTKIGMGAFNGCTNLTSITLSEGLVKVSLNAFKDTGLTSITVPASVTTFESGWPFAGIESVYMLGAPPDTDIFVASTVGNVYVKAVYLEDYKGDIAWRTIADKIFAMEE